MNKSILTIAVAATMAVSTAAVAAPTVYGNINLSVNDIDSKEDLDMSSNTSAFGVKGSEDLGDGLKAIYKIEFQVDIADGGSNGAGTANLVKRDQFVGLKGGMGTLKLGTFSSNYKQKGGKVDSMYRTQLEGRGLIHTQSQLHNGRDFNRGRITNAVSYTTPKMAGIELVANTTLSNPNQLTGADETTGVGLRWSNKAILVYFDWIDTLASAPKVPGSPPPVTGFRNESAMKVGGKFKTKVFHISAQYEDSADVVGYDYAHVNGGFNFNKNNAIEATIGTASHATISEADTTSYMLAYNHKMSKMTNVYVGYGDRTSDTAEIEDSVLTAGLKKKF